MKYNVMTYLIGEGFENVFKNKKSAITSIIVMCITMLLFGIFFVMGQNLNHFIKEVEYKQGMQVFMNLGVTDEEIKTLKEEILLIDGVNPNVQFISQTDALEQLKNRFGEDGTALEGYNVDIFPVSFMVNLKDLNSYKEVYDNISKLENVESIRYSDKTMETLSKIAKGIKIGTYGILICLVIFSVFIITNTIKLTVHARRREISIMKYVGATNSFIRWPFAVEGIIIGIISGAISIVLLAGIYSLAVGNVGFIQFLARNGGLTLLDFSSMFNLIIIVYLFLGIGIGVMGSTISMRKYLKV